MRKAEVTCLSLGIIVLVWCDTVFATLILDRDYFSSVSHTLIDFETDGEGNPVDLSSGSSRSMSADEYSALGVTFNPSISWVNDGGNAFNSAQSIGGSPEIGIPGASNDDFLINFSTSVRSFGFWVINNNQSGATPTFEVYGAEGLIDTIYFDDAAIDGSIGVADYGFLGFYSDQEIVGIHVTKQATMIDDLIFSSVPEPTTALLLGLGGLLFISKRRS